MKCRKLLFNARLGWWHRLWCSDCRTHALVDMRIQREIGGYVALMHQEAELARARRSVLKPSKRAWGLQYAVLCVAIGVIATFAILSLRPADKTLRGVLATTESSKSPITQQATSNPGPVAPAEKKNPPTVASHPMEKQPIHQVIHRPKNTPSAKEETLSYLNEGKDLFDSSWRLQERSELTLAMVLNRPLPPMKDDFVAPPEFLFASNESPEKLAQAAAEAEAQYRLQAGVTDSRLEKTVRFAAKNDSLGETCQSLREQTGVSVYAGRSVADDNVSLFIKAKPAKDVMRSLTRLFGYVWRRSGGQGSYSYVLEQEMKDQVAEDRLRNEDVSAALDKVVDASRSRPPSSPTPASWPVLEDVIRSLFGRLSINEFQMLRTGKDVVLSTQSTTRPLESDKAIQIMDNIGRLKQIGNGQFIWTGGDGQLPSEFPATTVSLTYKVAVLELGGIRASGDVEVNVKDQQGKTLMSMPHRMAIANVPGVGEGNPRNASINADLAKNPDLIENIDVRPAKRTYAKPERNYPIRVWTESTTAGGRFLWNGMEALCPPPSYCTTGDVWEAVHRETGMDIVADSFSRIIPSRDLSGPTFDVLNRYCDEANIRWRYQDKTLFARSTTYAWQRLNETPKRLVERWKLARKRGPLNIHELIAMGQLSDRQLDSFLAGRTIFHYHDIPEWGFVAKPWTSVANSPWRRFLRALAPIPPGTIDMMVNRPLEINKLSESMKARLIDEFGPWRNGLPVAVAIDYLPSETYFWKPQANNEAISESLGVTAPSADALRKILAQRNVQPGETEIAHTAGHLRLVFYNADRKQIAQIGDNGNLMYLTGN